MSNLARIITLRILKPNFKNMIVLARNFTDKNDKITPKDVNNVKDNNKKEVVLQSCEETDRMRIRRARTADVPRLLQFITSHPQSIWPGVSPPTKSISHVILCDYVSRALAQGHSMLAEHLETRKGWSQVRGVSLARSACPWDASMMVRWSKCVNCTKSKRLMQFTAHCLQTPRLHDKYNVNKLMQVTLIVPPDYPKSCEIATSLMKSSVQRGQESGFPLIRFDVTNSATAKVLEDLKLTKEWEMNFNYDNIQKDKHDTANTARKDENFIAVYSVITKPSKTEKSKEK